MKLEFAQKTDRGLIRSTNEDALFAERKAWAKADVYLFAVADGLGGLPRGEEASRLAVAAVSELFLEKEEAPPDPAWFLASAVQAANAGIWVENRPLPESERMASTLTLALFYGTRLFIAHIGDCRAYRLRDGLLECLTRDHALDRGTLTRVVGWEAEVQPDLSTFDTTAGDRYLFCSDGLHGVVPEQRIREILERETPERAATGLIRLANDLGGPDNISLQCINVE